MSRATRPRSKARRAAPTRANRPSPATRRAESEHLPFTLDSIGDGLLSVDLQQRITLINRAAQQLLGWQRDEALGQSLARVFRLINAETRQVVTNPVGIVLREGCTLGLPVDTVLVAKDGTEYFVSSSVAPIRSRNGKLNGAVLVFRDITRLRQAELALKEARQFAASLIENSLDMIIAVDQQRRIIEFNPAAERTFGYTKSEVLGQDVSILYADSTEGTKVNQTARVLGSVTMEVWNRRKNGKVFPVLLAASQLKNAAGQVIGTMGVSRDITDLKRAEEQRIRSEQLTALGRMAAALAHEINNPLQAIRSTLDLILDFPLPEREREEGLKVIRQEIEQLSQITERILRAARPAPAARRMVSVSELVRQTLALVSKHLQHLHIRVTQDIQETPPVLVAPEQMTRVFLNILLNGIEAAGDNGHLHIAARAEQEEVIVSFYNNGPPIHPEEMSHIFEPFYTTKSNGTGLGLYIARNIVQQHNGTLAVENVSDERGVRLTIRLPLGASAANVSLE